MNEKLTRGRSFKIVIESGGGGGGVILYFGKYGMLELFCTQHSVEVMLQPLPEIKVLQQWAVNRSSKIFSCCAPLSHSETTSAPSESVYTITVHRKI